MFALIPIKVTCKDNIALLPVEYQFSLCLILSDNINRAWITFTRLLVDRKTKRHFVLIYIEKVVGYVMQGQQIRLGIHLYYCIFG